MLRKPVRLRLETLEDRSVPATFTVTNGNDAGAGSLRQALLSAKSAAGADQIVFADSVNAVSLVSGQLVIDSPVTITGRPQDGFPNSVHRAGANKFRILEVAAGVNATLANLAIFDGNTAGDGAGILNRGTLTLNHVAILDNHADGRGGGIFNAAGSVTLVDSRAYSNTSEQNGGFAYVDGGSLTVLRSTIESSVAKVNGGHIYSASGAVTITDAIFQYGDAKGSGGGIYVSGGTFSAKRMEMLVGRSVVDGGGLYLDTKTPVLIVNSFIKGCTAKESGSAIFNRSPLTLSNCTIVNNSSFLVGPDHTSSGGGIFTANVAQATTRLVNTIVLGNLQTAVPPVGTVFVEIAGKPVAAGSVHNLIGDPDSAGGLVHGTNGNILGKAATTGRIPLPFGDVFEEYGSDTGGYIRGAQLRPGSPAIDAGDNTDIAAGVTTDQRGLGYPRVVHGTVDIGSLEYYDLFVQITPILGVNSLSIQAANILRADQVTIKKSADGTSLLISDPTALFSPGAGSLNTSGQTVTVPLSSFVGGRIQVETRDGADSITVDWSNGPVLPTGAGSVFINGGGGNVYDDKVRVIGRVQDSFRWITGTSAAPGTSGTLRYVLPSSSRQYFVTKVKGFEIDTATQFDFITRLGEDRLRIMPGVDLAGKKTGRIISNAFLPNYLPVVWQDVTALYLYLSNGDTATTVNETTVDVGALQAAQLRHFVYSGGAGIDRLQIASSDFRLPVPGGQILFNGGAGTKDQIAATGPTNFTLEDTKLISDANGVGGVVNLRNVEQARLTADTINATLDASAFSGSVVLTGGVGADLLKGSQGRSILMGSLGADRIEGGDQEDILLDGYVFTSGLEPFQILFDEWLRTDIGFAARVDHLRNGGGLNGNSRFVWPYLFSDAASTDTLLGGGAADWIFGTPPDVIVQ